MLFRSLSLPDTRAAAASAPTSAPTPLSQAILDEIRGTLSFPVDAEGLLSDQDFHRNFRVVRRSPDRLVAQHHTGHVVEIELPPDGKVGSWRVLPG